MPWRTIKDTICTSDNLDLLGAEAERFFYRLIVQCDDFGRFDARPAIILAACFPLKIGSITPEHIELWLDELVDAELIRLYQVNNRPYLQFVTWQEHQRTRASKSKYPDPPTDDGHQQANVGQLSDNGERMLKSKSKIKDIRLSVSVGERPTTARTTQQPTDLPSYQAMCQQLFSESLGMTSSKKHKEEMTTYMQRCFYQSRPELWELAIAAALEEEHPTWNLMRTIIDACLTENRAPYKKKVAKEADFIDAASIPQPDIQAYFDAK